jgi:hypothetical protein
MSKEGVRIVPKVEKPLAPLTRMAMARGWHLKKAVPRNPEEPSNGEFKFHVPEGDGWVILRDDIYAGIKFIAVLGNNKEAIGADIRNEFEHWTELELFSWWDRAVETGDADDKVDAVLFLGVNTPEQQVAGYVDRIRAALGDGDKDVRNAAVAAVAYADWRVFCEDLEQVVASDADDAARERATMILNGWSAQDGAT